MSSGGTMPASIGMMMLGRLIMTLVGQTSTWNGNRSASRCRMSRITAPVGDVTTPITRAAISAALLRSPVATKLLENSSALDEAHEAEIAEDGSRLPLAARGWIIFGVSLALWALIFWALSIL